eukprot:COSAG03_NODE_7482_length_911_cov_1.674877_1_plen_45_part_10
MFARTIDHPSWFPSVRHYMGDAQPAIHEMFVNVRCVCVCVCVCVC